MEVLFRILECIWFGISVMGIIYILKGSCAMIMLAGYSCFSIYFLILGIFFDYKANKMKLNTRVNHQDN